MKNNKLRLSGMALPGSISFFGDRYHVEIATNKEKKPKVKKTFKFKHTNYFKKIPFVRGIVMLFDVIVRFFLELEFKFKIVFLLALVSIFFAPETVAPSRGWFWDNYLNFILYGGVVVFIFYATKNHGAEHKTINAYENGENLNLENVRKQAKEHPRCGGTLVSWFIILAFILFIVGIERNLLIDLGLFSVCYEISKLARRKGLGFILFLPSYLLQKLTTREPDDGLIEKSVFGLKEMLKKELEVDANA